MYIPQKQSKQRVSANMGKAFEVLCINSRLFNVLLDIFGIKPSWQRVESFFHEILGKNRHPSEPFFTRFYN